MICFEGLFRLLNLKVGPLVVCFAFVVLLVGRAPLLGGQLPRIGNVAAHLL